MTELSQLLDPSRISCRLQVQSKKRALQSVAELLADSIDDEELSDMDIFDALLTRERLGSTALGHGVALPHSRLAAIDAPMAALITLDEGVDYEATDGEAVDVIFALLVPKECNDEHLKILAALARQFSSESFRQSVRSFKKGDADALFQRVHNDQIVTDEHAQGRV